MTRRPAITWWAREGPTTEEQRYLRMPGPDGPPPGFGWTVVVHPAGDASDFARRFREVWGVVATWGRWSDDALAEWPSVEACLASLSPSFAASIRGSVDLASWLADLHDREWVVWAVSTNDHRVTIGLVSDAMPMSAWPVHFVVERLGGRVESSALSP